MRIYPVRIESQDSDGVVSAKVWPFSSFTSARKFRTEQIRKETTVRVELLKIEDFEANKDGLLKAFKRGQELAI